jgi:hypothetical protein
MKSALLRVAAFVLITLLLTWLWGEGGRVLYGRFLKLVAPSIYDLFGFDGARVGAFRQRYVNFVPFVGLLLVTPRLSAPRRAFGLVVGLFVLFCGHLALNLTETGAGRARHLPVVPSLVSDTLPFLVWLVVAAPAFAHWLPGAPPADSPPEAGGAAGAEPPATAIERSSTPDA